MNIDFDGIHDPEERDKSAGFQCEYQLSGAHVKLAKLGLAINGRGRPVRREDIVMIPQWDSPRHE